MSMNDALCYHGRYVSTCRACQPDTGFGPLFDPPPTRANMGRVSPRLNRSEASQVEQERRRLTGETRSQAGRILAYLNEHGPHTRRELADILDIEMCSVCPAVDGLLREAYVIQTDGKDGRPKQRRNGGTLLIPVPNGSSPEHISTIIPRAMRDFMTYPTD